MSGSSSGKWSLNASFLKKVQIAILPKTIATLIFKRANDYQVFISDLMDIFMLTLACGSASLEILSSLNQMASFRRVWARSLLTEFHFLQESRESICRLNPKFSLSSAAWVVVA